MSKLIWPLWQDGIPFRCECGWSGVIKKDIPEYGHFHKMIFEDKDRVEDHTIPVEKIIKCPMCEERND
jgi:hypothetical protein